jgi:two-component system, sensor histidine kinase PdtaS
VSALFDHGTGVFAVLLSAALAKWFFVQPIHSLDIGRAGDVADLAVFVAIGILSATIFEALHRVASDLASANRRLLAAEGDKDMLLSEASHRFKNELTMLSALLRLQERTVADETARGALSSTADRVHVLARVHERLERADGDAVVDAREFVSALCDDLKAALVELRPINLVVEAQSHRLRQDRAVPMGLVINELLTNALKYAFPGDRPGTVRVTFERQGDEFLLTIADNGVGMAFDGEPRGSGLGQRLVRSMVAQLGGTFAIEPDSGAGGTVATVRFPSRA